MLKFYLQVFVYLFSFVVSLFGLSALDIEKMIRKGYVGATWVLYFTLAMSMAYLLGNFLMGIIYYFY
ncbi:MAG: DUF1146 domain-containing protein [Erysipelotrichaceae bacterium]|nr:DUF1146 domain-containing protein [Erysipelotrichaceae bacterium]